MSRSVGGCVGGRVGILVLVDGWVSRWSGGCLGRWVSRWVGGCLGGRVYVEVGGCLGRWVDEWRVSRLAGGWVSRV